MSAVNRLCLGVTKWYEPWHCDRPSCSLWRDIAASWRTRRFHWYKRRRYIWAL